MRKTKNKSSTGGVWIPKRVRYHELVLFNKDSQTHNIELQVAGIARIQGNQPVVTSCVVVTTEFSYSQSLSPPSKTQNNDYLPSPKFSKNTGEFSYSHVLWIPSLKNQNNDRHPSQKYSVTNWCTLNLHPRKKKRFVLFFLCLFGCWFVFLFVDFFNTKNIKLFVCFVKHCLNIIITVGKQFYL